MTDRVQSQVFGEVAELYHRHRPDYPAELFAWMSGVVDLADDAQILDIGAGTGKSSAWFLDRGHRVTAIEPDAAMAAVAESNAAANGDLTVENVLLQDFEPGERRWGLAVSGQAWHWADPATRFEDAASCLESDGWLCAFWNRPEIDVRPFAEEVGEIYRRQARSQASGLAAVQFPGSKAAVSAATPRDEFDNSGLFGEVMTTDIRWAQDVTTADHCANLRTQSDHRMLPPDVLEQVVVEVARAIDAVGGRYPLAYTTHAYAAQVRG